jgi:hypothetical protein
MSGEAMKVEVFRTCQYIVRKKLRGLFAAGFNAVAAYLTYETILVAENIFTSFLIRFAQFCCECAQECVRFLSRHAVPLPLTFRQSP